MKKIVFLTHTNYHLLTAFSLVADEYSAVEAAIFHTQPVSRSEKIKREYPNLELSHFPTTGDQNNPAPEGKKIIRKLLEEPPGTFVIFNQHSFLAVFLSHHLSRKGSVVALAPDGAKAYATTTKITPRWTLKSAWKFQKYLRRNRLPGLIFYLPNLIYGNLRSIDQVWLQYPEKFRNLTGKQVKKIEILKSDSSVELVKEYFGYSDQMITPGEGQIFYLNQPHGKKRIFEFELKLLKRLKKKFPKAGLVVKLHPSTPEAEEEMFRRIDDSKVIRSELPAELFISSLGNSIILSCWSTVALVNNDSCRMYWIYPMLKKQGLLPSIVNVESPVSYILEVSSIDQISFP